MTLAAIRTELAAVVKAAAPDLNVYSHDHPAPLLPAALITWDEPIPLTGGTADGASRFNLNVRFSVGSGDPLLTSNGLDRLTAEAIPDAIRDHDSPVWHSANPIAINPPDPFTTPDTVSTDLVVAIHALLNETSSP